MEPVEPLSSRLVDLAANIKSGKLFTLPQIIASSRAPIGSVAASATAGASAVAPWQNFPSTPFFPVYHPLPFIHNPGSL